ncbi:MAG: hypothetical protein ACRDOL_32635, partial [Streptosporangiaceae bacterium]
RARTRARWTALLAPAAAALAVVVIASAAVNADRGAHAHAENGGEAQLSTTSGGPGQGAKARGGQPVAAASAADGLTTGTSAGSTTPMVPGPSISSYVSSGKIPPYYVAITSNGNPNTHPSYAVVRDTVTGQTLSTIAAPGAGGTVVAVTAASDDRTFVLDEQKLVSQNGNQAWAARSFVLMRLNSAGQPASLQRLAISLPYGQMLTGLALSADGTKLAIADNVVTDKKNPNLVQVIVYTLASGASRTWTGTGGIGFGSDDARSLSWSANGRTLAFSWLGLGEGPWQGVWLLNPAKRGGSLLADSREAVSWGQTKPNIGTPVSSSSIALSSPPAQKALLCQEDTLLTPNGSLIVCGAQQILTYPVPGSKAKPKSNTGFLEYSAATGRLAGILGHWRFNAVPTPELLWTNTSGTILIGITGAHDQVGVISGDEFTPLKATMAFYPADSGTW